MSNHSLLNELYADEIQRHRKYLSKIFPTKKPFDISLNDKPRKVKGGYLLDCWGCETRKTVSLDDYEYGLCPSCQDDEADAMYELYLANTTAHERFIDFCESECIDPNSDEARMYY